MVNQRKPPSDTSEETVESSPTVTELVQEILEDIIPDEDDEVEDEEIEDEDFVAASVQVNVDNEIASDSEDEYDATALYNELWDDVLAAVQDYASSLNEPDAVEDTTNGYSEINVQYGPLDSVSYTSGSVNSSYNLLTIYLLPNVQNFNAHNLVHAPPNSHYIQLTPSAYATQFSNDQYSIELSPADSQMFYLPSDTHTLHLSSLPNSTSPTALSIYVANLTSWNSYITGLPLVSDSQRVLLRANSHPSCSSLSHGSVSALSIQTLSIRTPSTVRTAASSTSICSCRSLPVSLDNSVSTRSLGVSRSNISLPPSSSTVINCRSCGRTVSQTSVVNSNQYSSETSELTPYTPTVTSRSSPARTPHSSPRSVLVDTTVPNQNSVSPVKTHSSPRSDCDNRPVSSSSTPVVKPRDGYLGRKRRRRYANNLSLSGSVNVEEQDEVPELRGRTRLGILFGNTESLQVWTNFMQSSEEVQNEVLRSTPKKSRQKRKSRQSVNKENEEPVPKVIGDSRLHGFNNLTRSQRDLLTRQNLPYGMVVYLENLILDHFEATPNESLVSPPVSSFERLILHAMAAYYSLTSISVDDESGSRVTIITNTSDTFQPPPLRLAHYLEDMERRQQNSGGSSSTK